VKESVVLLGLSDLVEKRVSSLRLSR
jgi:hypothetical protein